VRCTALAAGTYFGRPQDERRLGSLRLCRNAYAPHERIPAHAHASAYLCLALAGSCRERSGRTEVEVVAGSVGLLHALARRLALEFDRHDEASELALEGLTMECLAFFARDERRAARQPPRWLGAIVERLREVEPVSLAELAGESGVHPSTLARTFRRFHGCSLGDYRRRCRVERALAALRASDAPLSEIAARCGFADQSHLTRALRAAVGLPPGAFRRSVRG
jgi:AraC family transcriptional regulator